QILAVGARFGPRLNSLTSEHARIRLNSAKSSLTWPPALLSSRRGTPSSCTASPIWCRARGGQRRRRSYPTNIDRSLAVRVLLRQE
ncbi:hypothetical protein PMAYCL1PPCAC_22895, partial [Pristionchus mayeri]